MSRIKVGLDQWVVVNAGVGDLLTDGLSGCVAVMAWTDRQGCLAHVFSGCDATNVAAYRHQLDLPIVVMRRNGGLTGGAVAYSDDRETWLAGELKGWLREKIGRACETYPRVSGVRLRREEIYGWSVYTKEEDDPKLYRSGYENTDTGVRLLTNWGRLSRLARPVAITGE